MTETKERNSLRDAVLTAVGEKENQDNEGALNNEREREKRSCFPVLINLGNKSENIAKNGIHCKRLKTVLLIITELPPFN